jgi:uncharacterized membrane protein
MKPLCLALLLAVPALAHTPSLERLPQVALAQVEATPAPDVDAANVEEAKTESSFLKFLGALLTLLMPVVLVLAKNWRDVQLAKKDESKLAMGIGIALQLFAAFLTAARAKLEPALKAALADGVLTEAEGAELRSLLVQMALTDLPPAVMESLSTAFGPALNTWLGHQADVAIAAAAKTVVPR